MTASEPAIPTLEGGFLMTAAGQRLFKFLHGCVPERPAITGIVVCPPLSGERSFSQRALYKMACHLAAQNFPTLRYDCIGSGDSEGGSENATVATHLDDTALAIRHLLATTGAERVILVGLQYGALLARLAAARDARVSGLVLIDPVISGATYWNELLRGQQMNCVMRGLPAPKLEDLREVSEGGAIEIKGEAYSAKLYEQLVKVDLRHLDDGCRTPTLLVRYDSPTKSNALIDQYIETLVGVEAPVEVWRDDGGPFWTERTLFAGYLPTSLYAQIQTWIQGQQP